MGASGLWLGFEAIGRKDASGGLIFVGVLMVITGVGWGLAALADFYLLAKVRIFYKAWSLGGLCTVKLGFKELLNKEQIGFKELFTDYQLFYTINLLLNKELLAI